jgi:hypothetical protein
MAARAGQHARQLLRASKADMHAYRANDCNEPHVKTKTIRRAWRANISIAADIRQHYGQRGGQGRLKRERHESNANARTRVQWESAMKAHEVRLLCRCPVCGKLGNEQAMVKVCPMKTPAHDRCAFEQVGDRIVNEAVS